MTHGLSESMNSTISFKRNRIARALASTTVLCVGTIPAAAAPTPSGLADLASAQVSTSSGSDTFAIRADVVHVGDGQTIENGVVVIEGANIKSVGTEAGEGVRVVEVDGHVSPGLIAVRDATGAGSENDESTRKMTPTADVARAFDPSHPAWKHVVRQGVTTVIMTPSSSAIAGGTAAVVSPARGEIVRRGALLPLGLSSRSISNTIAPTSYAGLYQMLDEAFASAEGDSPLARAKRGELPVLLEAVSRVEVGNAIAFAKEHGLTGALVGAPRAGDQVDAIAESGLSVVFEPDGIGAQPHRTASALALEEAGVPFAFTSDAQSRGAAAMRMTVARFLRDGLKRESAMRALTETPAMIAGVDATHGTVAAGKAADLVVWSGDPLELTSRVLQVYAGGEAVLSEDEDSVARTGEANDR